MSPKTSASYAVPMLCVPSEHCVPDTVACVVATAETFASDFRNWNVPENVNSLAMRGVYFLRFESQLKKGGDGDVVAAKVVAGAEEANPAEIQVSA